MVSNGNHSESEILDWSATSSAVVPIAYDPHGKRETSVSSLYGLSKTVLTARL